MLRNPFEHVLRHACSVKCYNTAYKVLITILGCAYRTSLKCRSPQAMPLDCMSASSYGALQLDPNTLITKDTGNVHNAFKSMEEPTQ
eukprot:3334013-Amphidinium_carterae.1